MSYPGSPHEISYSVDLLDLVDLLARYRNVVFEHNHGLRAVQPDELRAACLGELVAQAALSARAQAGRWVAVVAAFGAGATVTQVRRATGLDADELSMALRMWADEQLRHGFNTEENHAEVLRLAEEVADGGE
jgi:hypothetical protein